jgi:hypothetical protein
MENIREVGQMLYRVLLTMKDGRKIWVKEPYPAATLKKEDRVQVEIEGNIDVQAVVTIVRPYLPRDAGVKTTGEVEADEI